MTKTRDLANLIADSKIGPTEIDTAGTYTVGGIVTSGNVDGRDVSVDGAKLDGIEASADVTDTTNVTAAGALMDSEVTNLAAVKALNQGLATTDEPTFDNTNLAALSAVLGSGATHVDVFVYDTSKDSDGGAWRHRTTDKSWYNESSGTKRGSRKEFPAVAIIAITNTLLTIYDADDPDMSMWMVFDCNAQDMLGGAHASGGSWLTRVKALNGELFISSVSGYSPYLFAINFINEKGRMWDLASGQYCYNGNIAQRNDALDMYLHDSSAKLHYIYLKDVDAKVFPNTPIDPSTGLPTPTIAVAHSQGFEIVHPEYKYDVSSTVVNKGTTADSGYFSRFLGNNLVGVAPLYYGIYKDIHVQESSSYLSNTSDANYYWADNDNGTQAFNFPRPLGNADKLVTIEPRTIVTSTTASTVNNFYGQDGLTIHELGEGDITDNAHGMNAYIASDYNTGWQVGDNKFSTLSDTDTTNVTDSELVTNGDGSSTTGWTAHNATLSIVSGRLRVADNGLYTKAYQGVTTVVGKCYVVAAEVGAITGGSAVLTVGAGSPAVDNWYTYSDTRTTVGSLILSFVATATTTYIGLGTESTHSADFDDISFTIAEKDRSVYQNGLRVYGTVTKSAVATGADLVAYSGFSSNGNYLSQPYNSHLDFTGDFCISGWFKSASSGDPFINRLRNSNSAGSGFLISTGSNSTLTFAIYTQGFQSTGRTTVSTTRTHTGSNWQQVFAIRRSGMMELYVDGKLIGTANQGNTSLADTSGQPPLLLGQSHNYGTHFGGYLALWRISATAPSPDQIKKIYNDEKHLFQTNAKATLYGSSDTVTALAHDDVTKELHVGTSAGRSTFQGLARTANTTAATGVAISASNGLVADD